MRYFILITWFVIFCVKVNGQAKTELVSGQVSFISSQNVYVKFKTTEGITAGDTLYIPSNGILIPSIIVNNLSSSSCVGTVLAGQKLSVSDLVMARAKIKDKVEKF